MGSLPRARHPAPEPRALTVAPFDVAGAGVGDVPSTVAIETPDAATALFIYTEPERTDPLGYDRCMTALNAFRMGYEEAGGRAITAALVAGIEAANDALYTPRQGRHGQTAGIGLTALAVRGPDAFVIQAGPGQAFVAGGNDLIALPPLNASGQRGDKDDDHVPALGLAPTLEPNLFHVDASGGLCATLCHSALAPILRRDGDDNAPLRSFDAQTAAEYLVRLGERYRIADACGVVVSAGETVQVVLPPPPRPPPARPLHPTRPVRRAPPEAVYGDDNDDDDAFPATNADLYRRYNPAPPLPRRSPPREREALRDRPPLRSSVAPRDSRTDRRTPQSFNDEYEHNSYDEDDDWDNGSGNSNSDRARDEWNNEDAPALPRYRADARSPARSFMQRSLGPGQIMGFPTRLVMFAAALLCTLAVFLGVASVRAWSGHQANVRAIQQLDDIEADRAHAVEIAKHDPPTAYVILEPLVSRLAAVVRSGRQTRRVQEESSQLAKAFDMVGNVTRVVPKLMGQLDHLDGTIGNHRLLRQGDDGQLYLYDRDDRGNWALFNYDALSGTRGAALFSQGQVALRNPAGELRGLVWSGGPATSDRTRLFVRTANGSWAEIPLQGLPDRRPIAVAMANDTLYLLDRVAGAIFRVSLRDNTPAKIWTSEGAVADLKTAVDLTTDGQTIWVLLADGRVRGFAGTTTGTGSVLFMPSTLPPLKGVVAIATSATSQYLYVAEGNGGRILRIRKADGKIMQVLRSTGDPAPGLDSVQSMTVDEAHGTLWCVTADGVVSFLLPSAGV